MVSERTNIPIPHVNHTAPRNIRKITSNSSFATQYAVHENPLDASLQNTSCSELNVLVPANVPEKKAPSEINIPANL